LADSIRNGGGYCGGVGSGAFSLGVDFLVLEHLGNYSLKLYESGIIDELSAEAHLFKFYLELIYTFKVFLASDNIH